MGSGNVGVDTAGNLGPYFDLVWKGLIMQAILSRLYYTSITIISMK